MKTRIKSLQCISKPGEIPVRYQVNFKKLHRKKTISREIVITNVPRLYILFLQVQNAIDKKTIIKKPKRYIRELQLIINLTSK